MAGGPLMTGRTIADCKEILFESLSGWEVMGTSARGRVWPWLDASSMVIGEVLRSGHRCGQGCGSFLPSASISLLK